MLNECLDLIEFLDNKEVEKRAEADKKFIDSPDQTIRNGALDIIASQADFYQYKSDLLNNFVERHRV